MGRTTNIRLRIRYRNLGGTYILVEINKGYKENKGIKEIKGIKGIPNADKPWSRITYSDKGDDCVMLR